MSTTYVILDCDGGSDDAWALLLLLKAHEEKSIELIAVTICGSGNTDLENATRNIFRILKACGREEIPIFLGAAESLVSPPVLKESDYFHGANGFGDILLPDSAQDINELVQQEHAVSAIYRFCGELSKQVSVVAVGPLTNIALCYSMYGKQFDDNIKDLYIMGGNHEGIGNITPSAEFNFFCDPEAAHIVLKKARCPITILPWEPCSQERFFISVDWRLNDFGPKAVGAHPGIELLNEVERVQYTATGYPNWNPCDAMLVGVFLFNTQIVCKESRATATVDIKSEETRGKMLVDVLQEMDTNSNATLIRIIEVISDEFFKEIVHWAVGLTELEITLPNADENANN